MSRARATLFFHWWCCLLKRGIGLRQTVDEIKRVSGQDVAEIRKHNEEENAGEVSQKAGFGMDSNKGFKEAVQCIGDENLEGHCGHRDPDPNVTRAANRLNKGRYAYRFVKRLFDIVFSLFVLVALGPIWLFVAIAIKIDDPDGPIVFTQTRVGKDGKLFRMHKFRSMYADAEEHLASLSEFNEKTGPVFKMKDDPRVTRVGRVIRKLSLDEVCQFVDVLTGTMSIVGPRPALPDEVATYDGYQAQRLLVKPGITCYWQTRKDRDSISFDEWMDLDMLYIQECSMWVDFKIVVQTIGVVVTAQGS